LDSGEVETGPAEPPPPAPPVRAPRRLEKMAVRWQGVVGKLDVALLLEEVQFDPTRTTAEAQWLKENTPKAPEAGPAPPQAPPAPVPPPGRGAGLPPAALKRQQFLVLRSWDRTTGRPGGPLRLLQGNRLQVQVTLDGRFLCLRDALPSPDE